MLLPETLKLHCKEDFDFSYGFFFFFKDQMVSVLREQEVQVVCFNASNNLKLLLSAMRISKYIYAHEIDIIHCHLPWAGFSGRLLRRITGKPVIYSEHNKQERYHWVTRTLNRWTFGFQDHVIAVSHDVEASIRKNIKTKAPISTVQNGVNTDRFNPAGYNGAETRKELGIPSDVPVLGTVAVFRTQKRLDRWIDEAAKVKQRFPTAHFILVGDGPTESLIREKVNGHGLQECIHLPGRLEEVRPWLAAMNVFMISSEFEGLPVALLEAMSMQLPVVSTGAGGIKEVIRDNYNGLLVPVDQPDQLSAKVISLLEDHDFAKTLGVEARKTAIAEFGLGRMVSKLENLYHLVYEKGTSHGMKRQY